MKTLVCAICGNNRNAVVLYRANFEDKNLNEKTFSARRTPDRIHYRFLLCKKCGLIFSSPILSSERIKKLYKKSDFTYSNEAHYLANTYGYYLEKVLPESGRKNLKLLDIGCGNGFFLEKAKLMGVGHVFGVEPGKESVKKARSDVRKNIKIDVLRPGLFGKNYFDVICCFHTLDHVIDPNDFLKTVNNYLKPGGKILFITHNTSGLSVRLFKEKSPIFDIEHVYLFNPNTLSIVFIKNKFKKIKVFNLKNTYPLSYWLRLLPFSKDLKDILIPIFQKLKFLNIPLSLKAGNIVIIAEK